MRIAAIEGPERAWAITPSGSDGISNSGAPTGVPYGRKIYVGGTGDVKVTTHGGDVVTFKSVPVGTVLSVNFTQVFSAGTTATLLVGMY